MTKRNNVTNTLVLGFALFAMFFGAGNLIFPPYLGLTSGGSWFPGFLSFIIIDAGLGVVALVAIVRTGEGISGITKPLGRVCSALMIFACAFCLGPLVCIPRTAAVTHELAIAPIISSCPQWLSSGIFFALVTLMCIRPSKIADIVGKVLSPIMLAALAALIIKGFVTPIGTPTGGSDVVTALRDGLEAGYQTMDMLGAVLLSVVFISSVHEKGYEDKRSRLSVTLFAGAIAAAGLFFVYGGLAYIGASASGEFSPELGQSGLVLAITSALMGDFGSILLGVIVTAACLTTAVGLVSSCAGCFMGLFNLKRGYKALVTGIAAFSFAVSNLGLSTIISAAAPVLDLIYPVLMTLIILSFFSKQIKRVNVYRFSAILTLAYSAYSLIDGATAAELGSTLMPLSSLGLGWMIPATLGAAIGAFVPTAAEKPEADLAFEGKGR